MLADLGGTIEMGFRRRPPHCIVNDGWEEFGEEKHMTTMHGAILEVVHGNETADEKIRIINTLISDEHRWTSLYIVWGLIAVIILTIAALIAFLFLANRSILKLSDFPQGIIALGATALGALAAYLVPPSRAGAGGTGTITR
jgi:hypothetical protein